MDCCGQEMVHYQWFSWYAGNTIIHGEVVKCSVCGRETEIVKERKRTDDNPNKPDGSDDGREP